MELIKYQVIASEKNKISISLMESKQTELKTTDKKEAINHAKNLLKKYNSVSFNFDTYKDNQCIKNDFGYYTNKGIEIYSTIDYTNKKQSKPLIVNTNEFFNL